jgi:hypothetical protein
VLYRSSPGANGCGGSSLVAHGRIDDLLVEANQLFEEVGQATASCWGIDITPGNSFDERFQRAVVRRNLVVNMGSAGIALGSCVDCLVENNVIVHEQPHAIIGIRAPAGTSTAGDSPMQALTVRNNSVWTRTTNSVAIAVGGQGNGHRILSNALQSTATTDRFACLSLDLPASAYAAVDHNVCGYVAGSTQREWEEGSGELAAWRVSSGFDGQSRAGAPGFASPGSPNFSLGAAGAAALLVDAGHPASSAADDFVGLPRGPQPDAGAYERRVPDALFANGFDTP